jgi:hypothetical protein
MNQNIKPSDAAKTAPAPQVLNERQQRQVAGGPRNSTPPKAGVPSPIHN